MGILSKRRHRGRIVKKRKVKGQKKINVKLLDPSLRKYWDEKKSLTENFEIIGLKMEVNSDKN